VWSNYLILQASSVDMSNVEILVFSGLKMWHKITISHDKAA